VFGQSGKPAALLELYHIMPIDIVKAAKEAIAAR